jgi:hypothetical protein
MLEKLNKLLGISEENYFTEFALTEATNKVLNYCNINEIPTALETTVIRIAMDIYRDGEFGEESATGQVLSVTRGDTSTTFADTTSTNNADDYIGKYKAVLNGFRRVRW